MKKQYRYYETTMLRYEIVLYHDGNMVNFYKVWLNELDDEVDKLKEQGYSYGFTQKEVDEAKERYERMLENIIVKI